MARLGLFVNRQPRALPALLGDLTERVQQDAYNGSNDISQYFSSADHNGRRLMVVPIVNPTSTSVSSVSGFGEFLLITNGNSSNFYKHDANGNDPFCAIYVGPYLMNADDPGGATSGSGAYRVKLTE